MPLPPRLRSTASSDTAVSVSEVETSEDRHLLNSLAEVTADVLAALWDDRCCMPLLTAMSDEEVWDMLPARLMWHTLSQLRGRIGLSGAKSEIRRAARLISRN